MKTDLIYGVEDRPPFKDALFAALQHLLAIFVAIITPPLIIASALKLDVEKTSFLVSMSLFASGVSTFIQCRRIGPIGAKLLCIQGTSFSFIGPIIATGLVGGLPLIFGSCIAAAPIEMVVSRTFKYLRNIITPLVSAIVFEMGGERTFPEFQFTGYLPVSGSDSFGRIVHIDKEVGTSPVVGMKLLDSGGQQRASFQVFIIQGTSEIIM